MRIERLTVHDFAGIDQADITFGPRLNVLFGPNDLGKSRIARAIRAALLLPAGASAGQDLVSWKSERPARVALVFVDKDGKYWRVSKTFGDEGPGAGTAQLAYSKDGTNFQADVYKAREVDEKIRALLRWGIAAPGGKSGQRGFPESFLTHVLLAEQTQVATLFEKSLGKDLDGGGHVHLKEVLQVLAHDPALKKVLDEAQAHVDRFFTEKGNFKRVKGTQLITLRDKIDNLEEERRTFQARVDASSTAQEHLTLLRDRQTVAREEVAESEEKLADTRRRYQQSTALESARAACANAAQAVRDVDAEVEKARQKQAAASELAAALARSSADVDRTKDARESARKNTQLAEEGLRRAESDEGGLEREKRRAELETVRVAATGREREATLLRERAISGERAEGQLAEALTSEATAQTECEAGTREKAQLVALLSDRESETKRLAALKAYVQWRAACAAGTAADDEEQQIVALRARADAAEAVALEEDAKATLPLPVSTEIDALDDIDKALTVAEARLQGVGVSVRITPRRDLELVTRRDDQEESARVASGTTLAIDAIRTVALRIEDLVEVEISAGSDDHRSALDRARAEWSERVKPVLEQAKSSSIAALRDARRSADDAARKAEQLREEARLNREQANLRGIRVTELRGRSGDASSFERGFVGLDRNLLEKQLVGVGSTPDQKVEALLEAQSAALGELNRRLEATGRMLAVADSRLIHAREIVGERREAVADALKALGGSVVLARARAESERAAAVRERDDATTALAALDGEVNQAVTEAKHALASATAAYDRYVADEELAATMHTEAERAHAEATGALTQLREHVNRLDPAGARERRAAAEKLLNELPIPTTRASAADVDQATSAHAQAKAAEADASLDLAKAEGAVETVGGHVVAEELQQIVEALDAVKHLKHEVEVDAQAWRLLAETLKAVQAEQGAHLGRSLSKPVTERLADLTRGRYGVELGPNLEPRRIEGIGAGTIEEMIAACSVGTREQLATLVRVTLAECMKCTIVLDDHLVQTDPARLAWFRALLRRAASETQLIILTCRPDDYLASTELPDGTPSRDIAGGLVRATDLARLLGRDGPPRKREETMAQLEAT